MMDDANQNDAMTTTDISEDYTAEVDTNMSDDTTKHETVSKHVKVDKRRRVAVYYNVVRAIIGVANAFGFKIDGWIPLTDTKTGQKFTKEYVDSIRSNHYKNL